MGTVRWLMAIMSVSSILLGVAPAAAEGPALVAEGPDKAAESWLLALVTDTPDLRARTCEAHQLAIDEGRLWGLAFPGVPDGARIPGPTRLDFSVVDQTDDSARVRVLGETGRRRGPRQIINVVWVMTNEFGHWRWCGAGTP